MLVQYFNEYSKNLNRNMEFKVYGHAGKPFVVFPCQNGKFFDFEDQGMVNCIANYIENGEVQLFSVQSIDEETWSANGNQHERILLHEKWFNYVCDEFIPHLYEIHKQTSGQHYVGKIMTTGASMGGYHAVNFYLRRPDIFEGCLSLSGLFHATYFFPHYHDEIIYYNSPTDFMVNLDIQHPYVNEYRKGTIIICCGQGAWEDEAKVDARILKDQFERLNIPAWVDLWGEDVNHDWPWWLKQFPYFIERILHVN